MSVFGSGAESSLITEVKLRCRACGAPYAGGSNGEILTCGYCGTSQRMVDARAFLDHFSAQVSAFLRQAIPPGLDVSRSATIDPVARLAAFNSTVRPHLSTESEQYRFALFNLLSHPCIVLPFTTGSRAVSNVSPTTVSIFAEKVHAVSGLAADDYSRDLIRRSSGVATAYQSALVADGLLRSNSPERLHLLSQDFAAASEAIAGTGRWLPLATRLSALSRQAKAADQLLSGGKLDAVRELVVGVQQDLAQARAQFASVPEVGYMTAAVEQELASSRILLSMVTVVEASPTVAPHPLAYLPRLMEVLDWLSQHAPGEWSAAFASLKLREEVLARASELRIAQAGRGTVRALNMGGGVLVPFWVVELPYTFETGVLWNKRGKEVPEILLVAATAPADLSNLIGAGVARALTDVFSTARGGPQLNQLYNRFAGKEQKITDSGTLAMALQNVAPVSIVGQPAVPPLTTGSEAIRLVHEYLNAVRAANPKVASQLRASSPRVLDLVYLPATPGAPSPVPWLGSLSPMSVGNPQALQGLGA